MEIKIAIRIKTYGIIDGQRSDLSNLKNQTWFVTIKKKFKELLVVYLNIREKNKGKTIIESIPKEI